jgi:preprotein translocase subunit SecA
VGPAGLEKALRDEWASTAAAERVESRHAITDEDIVEKVVGRRQRAFERKVAQVGSENFTQFERMVLLQSIDTHWREHLAALDYLRQGIHLRGYAQKQPKQEYKREAFELFGQMLDGGEERSHQDPDGRGRCSRPSRWSRPPTTSRIAPSASPTSPTPGRPKSGEVQSTLDESTAPQSAARRGPAAGFAAAGAAAHVGRNDPCPCGSGKKYKHCHGQLT